MARPIQRSEFLAHVHASIRTKKHLDNLKQEISLLHQTQKRLQELVVRDDLTGLYNHRYLHNLLPREIARSERLGYSFALILIDIDNFKEYNDMFGHLNGDIMLHEFAAVFQSNIRSGDVAIRYGGDEFALILPGADENQAQNIADALRHVVRNKKFQNEEKLPSGNLTISAGISTCPFHATTSEQLIEIADRALYTAKHKGRDQIVIAEIAA
jgi:diguanylate cyclase (GGDEF)-like protein